MAGYRRTKKSSRWISFLLGVLLLAIIVAAAAFVYTRYAKVGSEYLRTDVTTLDLQGRGLTDVKSLARFTSLRSLDLRGNWASLEDYEYLQRKLPNCDIRFDVPLGGQNYDSLLTELALTDLPSDWKNILSLTHLQRLTVERCTNPAAMETLHEGLPYCVMSWNLGLGGEWYDVTTRDLAVDSPSVYYEELLSQLTWFRSLQSVKLTGAELSPEHQRSLLSAYPDIDFSWMVSVGNTALPNDAAELIFSQTGETDTRALSDVMDLLPGLTLVDFTGSRVPAEDRLAFRDEHEDVSITWTVPIDGVAYPYDTQMLDFNNVAMSSTAQLESVLPYLPMLEKVEMCGCGFSNEEMDALCQRWPDIRFIWNVYFAGFTLRTDATYFCASMDGLNHPYLTNRDAEVFKYLVDMQGMDLGHMYISDISFLQYMPHMTYLIIAECPILDFTPLSYCKELKYLEAFHTDFNDLTPLLSCPQLRDLNLCYTPVPQKNAWEVLSQLTSLERLWWCNCPLNSTQQAELQKILPDCIFFMIYGGEPSGGAWRYHQNYYEMRDFFHMYYMPGGSNGVDEDGCQVIVDDHGREFHLFDYDGGPYWWLEERYAELGWYPYIIGVTA